MDTDLPQSHDEEPRKSTDPNAPVIDALKLFEGRREICLELDGVRYRLRITRRNKLILQK